MPESRRERRKEQGSGDVEAGAVAFTEGMLREDAVNWRKRVRERNSGEKIVILSMGERVISAPYAFQRIIEASVKAPRKCSYAWQSERSSSNVTSSHTNW